MRIAPAIPLLLAALPACGPAQQPVAAPPAAATQKAEKTEFLRFVPDDKEGGKLQVSAVTYRNPAGKKVTLYAAVHVADAKHYAELQERFAGHDALLYELIASPDSRPSPGDKRRSGVSMIQTMLKRGLELEFQLDAVDYRADNFVHADLTPRQFRRLQTERGESFVQLMWRAGMKQMQTAREGAGGDAKDFDIVRAFRNREGRHTLRMMFATMISDIERLAAGFQGKDGKSVLVEGRNQRAMEVFDERLAKGDDDLAIYYGAAHMPDFEKRLATRGFRRAGVEWLTAWDVTKRPDPVRKRGGTGASAEPGKDG